MPGAGMNMGAAMPNIAKPKKKRSSGRKGKSARGKRTGPRSKRRKAG